MAALTPIPSTYPPIIGTVDRVQDTRAHLTAGQVPISLYDISTEIYTKNKAAAPFCTLLEALGTITGHNDTHSWYEQESVKQRDTLDGSVPAGAATITVAHGNRWTVNDTLWYPAGNFQAVVTAISGNVLTVTWIGAVGVIPANAQIIRMSPAYEQYTQVLVGPTTKEVQCDNYYQDSRHGLAISDQAAEGKFRTRPDLWTDMMSWALEEHEKCKEKTLNFGRGLLLQTGAHPRGFCRGLYNFCMTNRWVVGAAPTRAAFDANLDSVIRRNVHADQNWWLIAGGTWVTRISGFAQAAERTQTDKDRFGMGILRWFTPMRKEVKVVHSNLFDHHGLDGLAFLVNVAKGTHKLVNHSRFATKRYDSILPFGLSGTESFYRTIFTLESKGEDINLAVFEGAL